MSSNLLMAVLMPHPPIIIPEIGKTETFLAQKTIDANNELSKKIVAINPDTIIIVTPHSIFNPYKIAIYTDSNIDCDFSKFRAPQVKFSYENNLKFVKKLKEASDIEFEDIAHSSILDHGCGVPLYFLNEAGYKGKIVAFNYCALDNNFHYKFGEFIRKKVEQESDKCVFIASGDLSHRLKPSAPAGYEPEAYLFDEFIMENIKNGTYEEIIKIDENLRYLAGECAYNSLIVALGVINSQPDKHEILSYEAPWGVGYLTAIL